MNSCVNLAEVNKPSAVYQLNWQTFVAAASYCYLIVQRAQPKPQSERAACSLGYASLCDAHLWATQHDDQ